MRFFQISGKKKYKYNEYYNILLYVSFLTYQVNPYERNVLKINVPTHESKQYLIKKKQNWLMCIFVGE